MSKDLQKAEGLAEQYVQEKQAHMHDIHEQVTAHEAYTQGYLAGSAAVQGEDWTYCKDAMPQSENYYQVACKGLPEDIAVFEANYSPRSNSWWDSDGDLMNEVYAWRPIEPITPPPIP